MPGGADPTPHRGGLPGLIHRVEVAVGIHRPGRSPWVWTGPAINFVGTLAVVLWAGLTYDLGWPTTVPLAVFCALSMFAMAAAVLGNHDADAEDDEWQGALREAPDPPEPRQGGGGGGGGGAISDSGPPGDGSTTGHPVVPGPVREPALTGAERPGRR